MTKKSSWDSILHDVGLAPPPSSEPEVVAAPEPPIAATEAVSTPPPPPAAPSRSTRRPASFGVGILDEPAQPPFAASCREDVPREMNVAESPASDLVAEIAATDAKSSSFFDMLPSFNIFGKKKPEPVATPATDEPLPANLFGAKPSVPKPAPQPVPLRTPTPPRASTPSPPRTPIQPPPIPRETLRDAKEPRERAESRERPRPIESPPEPRERVERSRSHRPERSLTPERAAAFADPWTDVATQLGAVAEKRRSEAERSEQPPRNDPPRRGERTDSGVRPETPRPPRTTERAPRSESPVEPREERPREPRKPREERPKRPHAEERPVIEPHRGEVPTWGDAVSTVINHNQSRRRR